MPRLLALLAAPALAALAAAPAFAEGAQPPPQQIPIQFTPPKANVTIRTITMDAAGAVTPEGQKVLDEMIEDNWRAVGITTISTGSPITVAVMFSRVARPPQPQPGQPGPQGQAPNGPPQPGQPGFHPPQVGQQPQPPRPPQGPPPPANDHNP